MAGRPHILIFNPDQWRGDVMGHQGNAAAVTPYLDEFARTQAVSFRNAFCQNPVCTPSRCSFMTGWYPHVRGHRTMHHMLHPERGEPNLLKLLKDNGYFVWWGGKNDLVPAQDGFDDYCDVKYQSPRPPRTDTHRAQDWRGEPDGDNYYSFYIGRHHKGDAQDYYDHDWAMVEGAIEQIRNAPNDQPLCIYLPLVYPHPPYGVEEPYYSSIDRAKIPQRTPAPQGWSGKPQILRGIYERQNLQSWSEERWRELRATYYGMCARVDHQFGLVLEALREAEMYDDTAIFFFSDHGDFTGDYGLVEKTQNTFEDCLTNVPFLVKPPLDITVQPRVSEALVELVDFTATVFDIAGIEPGYNHFGRSLLPLLSGKTDDHRNAVFCQGGRRRGETQAMELDSTSSQVSSGLYWPRVGLQSVEEPLLHTKATMCRTRDFKYVQRLYESDELYDLRNDPHELHNLIDDDNYCDVLAKLKDRLLRFYLETSDVVPLEVDRRT